MSNLITDISSLSLKQQIGQMIVVRASGYLFDHQIRYPVWEAPAAELKFWLQSLNIGGVILLGGSAAEIALRSQQLQNWAEFPLFMAADVEEGVGQRFAGATWFPPPMTLGAIARVNSPQAESYACQMGAITAKEALTIGINWIFAPVVDVNNNPHNPVINVRAFAEDVTTVSNLATAFIEGAKSYPILTTAKHFPGHGDTSTDSHLDLPIISHNSTRLAQIELPPFQQAIATGVDAVMTAHLLIPEWDQEKPATLSHPILTGKLRQQLGFDGLIVTDALIMGGVANYTSPEKLAVMAIAAGADILLMPENPEKAIEAVEEAVKSGILTETRIAESITRIAKAKQKISSQPNISYSLNQSIADNLTTNLSQAPAIHLVSSILQESLLKGGDFPVKPSPDNNGTNLIIVDELLNSDFLDRQTPSVILPKQFGYQKLIFDHDNLPISFNSNTLLQVFMRGNPFRGSAGLTPKQQSFYRSLLESNTLTGMIIYGSPYLLQWFKPLLPPSLPWVFSYGQMPQAQAIACQTLFGNSDVSNVTTENFL